MLTNEETERRPLAKLPSRKKGYHSDTFKPMKVISNHYYVELSQIELITIFSVKYHPFIPHDNSNLRNSLLKNVLNKISADIKKPIVSGTNIYSIYEYNGGELEYQADEYQINVKKVKVYDIKTTPNLLLAFLNNTLRNCMRKLNYVQIGKSGKFFNSQEKTNIDSLTMYNGFKSNFVSLEKGFYLRVDAAKKIVRNQTVLEHIDNLYKINKDLSKEDRRMIVKTALIGLVVMSNYGKTNYYTVSDIQYDELEGIVFDESQTKLIDYYKDKYRITIRNLKQPLLVAEGKDKKKPALLVPELMLMTGIPDDFDEMRRKKISESTIKPPHDKHKEIGGLMSKLKKIEELSTLEKMGIKVNQDMEEIKAKVIPSPLLELGKQNSIERGKQACFNLFNKPIFASKHDINLAIIYQKGSDIRMATETFEKTSGNLGVKLRINKYQCDRISTSKIDSEMDNAINNEDNICCIIIPNNMKTQYKAIKISALTKKEIVTQILTDVKLKNKNVQSIATKVLLQIIAKRGNTLWVPKPNCKIDSCMLAAYDNGKVGSKNVLGLCASINSTFSSIYSATGSYESNQNRFGKMVDLMLLAINAYVNRNDRPPKEIIIFQNSCSGDQVSLFHEFYIEPLKAKIQQVYNQSISLTMIMINVKTSERFFVNDNRGIGNVQAGTLVSSGLVSVNYDFYIVSQRSNRGCSVPNHYKVIYSSSEIEEGIIQEIAFSQCFNYVNWTGSIKVPGIMQYAKKLAKFNSEVLEPNTQISDSLSSKLYDKSKDQKVIIQYMKYNVSIKKLMQIIIFLWKIGGSINQLVQFPILFNLMKMIQKLSKMMSNSNQIQCK